MKIITAARTAMAVLVIFATAACANDSAQAEGAAMSESEAPQRASAEDMRIFDAYIGKFRSPTQVFDDGETEYYNTVAYEWFDRGKTIVKVTVGMEIPSQERSITSLEGFYGYDPFNRQLYTFGAFTRGTTGWGAIGEFDHETSARTVWAKSMDAEGVVTHVRDAFEVVDENTWKNKTSIRQSDKDEWKIIYEDVYTRMEN